MNRFNSTFPKITSSTILVLSLISLSGCAGADRLNKALDDGIHVPASSSDAYPLARMRSDQRNHVQTCGKWPEDLTQTKQNQPYANHGCAVQSNIAAEIADPSTIDRPRATDLALADNAAAAARNVGAAPSSGGGGRKSSDSGNSAGGGSGAGGGAGAAAPGSN